MREMKILGTTVQVNDDYLNINDLKFLKDNPRVYACTHGESNFTDLSEEEQQEVIFKKLKEEPSVKNLVPDVKRHGGLMEPILIRYDTMEVIEGNSRLAVYRKLNDESEGNDWELIHCDIISNLTDRQQAAFLNQIHVKGKTQWSAYEKANFAYVRKEKKWTFSEIAELFGESEATIRIRIKVIEMMKENKDSEQSHFSYYDVLVRNKNIIEGMKSANGWVKLLSDINNQGKDEETNSFTAQDIRKKLPIVLKKPNVIKKYVNREVDLDEAYQRAKISDIEDNVRKAMALLEDVSKSKISQLETGRFNAFKHSVRKLSEETKRISDMVQDIH